MSATPRLYVSHGRPVAAVRYDGTAGHRRAILAWLSDQGWPRYVHRTRGYDGFFMDGRYVRPGDWIVRRYDGEVTWCGDRDFWAFHGERPDVRTMASA